MQAPMISSPLKQTNEIDWISPLKAYIRQTYGDDPERYSEECSTLNRLRQDMRGAGRDSAAGRDLLYRYYGQLELLDLRFPVDENHIKISFTWFDAFTHKPTSQYSLAYEKASIIFNISAVLSCHAAHQNRHEDTGLKTAYHSFQASAGMFTYINENFLHAPSTDLNHETVRTLISVMLAQAQEVFLEKQIADGKKAGLLAKLASQAAFLFSQAVEGVTENVNKAVFEKVWLLLTQIKSFHMSSVAQYYQALSDSETGKHGDAICRLQSAERQAKDGSRMANSFPNSLPANSNLSSETGSSLVDINKRLTSNIQEKLAEFIKDNDFIYHQPIPSEASLTAIPKLPAAKAISVSELYQGQDIHRIIGPDIFQKIVPMSVTEQASLYDEEKAKLVRAESERAEIANDEMAASLDYLKLPSSLNVLKGGLDQELTVDEEFRGWCEELAGHTPFQDDFNRLSSDKNKITKLLDECTKQLDMEESVCEKMRSKYAGDWTQQPSSLLTSTLRSDIKNYRTTIDKASTSDATLFSTFRQNETEFDEMRSAGDADEADVLYQRAMIKAGAARKGRDGANSATSPGGNLIDEDFGENEVSVADQIANVEELLRKLNLIKRERSQVLKDLKEKIHSDDISQILILNKKNISNQEGQLFKAELEKFRPYQNRLLQANHKQASVMKELTRVYNDLLQDKRVRSEQTKYESFSRQRGSVMTKYQRLVQTFHDLASGLVKARAFYSEMQDTAESLFQNVEDFVNNRKSEGGQLLTAIEASKTNGSAEHADRERERLKEMMERMSMETSQAQSKRQPGNRPNSLQNIPTYQASYNPATSPPISSGYTGNPRSPPITATIVTPRTSSHPQTHNSPSYVQHQQRQQTQYNSTPPMNGYYQPQSSSSANYQPGHLRQGSSTSTAVPTQYSSASGYQYPASPPQGSFTSSQSQLLQRNMHEAYQQQTQTPPRQQQQPYSSPPRELQQQGSRQSTPLPPGFVPPPPPPGPPPPSQGQDPWAGLGAWK